MGYNEASRYLVIVPLRVKKVYKGFILLALNPRRAFDADHERFISDLVRQLTSMMIRLTTEEENQRREEYLVKELTDSERRLGKMAEAVPVGIYDLAPDGAMLWANTSFFNIMGVPLNSRDPKLFDWRNYIIPEDQPIANAAMGKCLIEKVDISDSLRLKKKWVPPGSIRYPLPADEEFWILYSASPDIGEDGIVRSLMGCVTDISHLKWAEQLQARIAEAAEKEKRKQEEFIDITSHEIRNPLSAITQCADSIIASFHDIKEGADARSLVETVKMNVEDAESILFCTVHQRRIINDILTLGKLDSGLLTVAPISFHPRSLVDEALQMFKAEFDASKIDVRVAMDKASVLRADSSVRGDCARMMQILVNLLTNAIKFTRTEETRKIVIRFGSSQHPPTTETFGPNFHWNPTEAARPDLTEDPEYGAGAAVYLYYCITDSGKGIPGEFANRVFSKFEQADRRTHTKYGGSGLGLFISRELAELQGGRIGVESEEAVGSTFGFYTKARCEQQQNASQFGTDTSQFTATDVEAQKMENDSLYQATNRIRPPLVPLRFDYKILLVEDNILNQRVLAKQLIKAGCVVHVANDGEEAIKFVQRSTSIQVDCILMDWEMPVCDGLTATRKIREIESEYGTEKNIIIGITANARPEQLAKAVDAGMNTIVPKPFRVAELLSKIGEYVGLMDVGS